jgi:hypothetical protein
MDSHVLQLALDLFLMSFGYKIGGEREENVKKYTAY